MLHRLKGGGFKLRLKAGSVRHSADSGHVEVVVRFRRHLALYVLHPDFACYVSAARTNLMDAPLVRFHPLSLHGKRCNPGRLKAWGFLIPYRGL